MEFYAKMKGNKHLEDIDESQDIKLNKRKNGTSTYFSIDIKF